ncbi:NUDIX domain-containing protein [Neptuniibacter sp. QD37_11]|uniref:NUDIX domain-containing protein n=1 Tax=Neptuniibacter sp. QD37_11 TaxID=3398209 RepID=UPI0039F47952
MKTAAFIGVFPILQNGHCSIFSYMLDAYDRVVIMMGSANERLSMTNPFTYEQKKAWIEFTFERLAAAKNKPNWNQSGDQLIFIPINDFVYNNTKWESRAYAAVADVIGEDAQVDLIGIQEDEASQFYLRGFPQWKQDLRERFVDVDSETVLNEWFRNDMQSLGKFEGDVPKYVFEQITSNPAFQPSAALEEFTFYEKEAQACADFPHIDYLKFNCADSVIVCKSHVLLTQRGEAPGKGCWALPGGYVKQGETCHDAAMRSLFAKTNLKVPFKIISDPRNITGEKRFDDPNRSKGIPRVTEAFYIEIDANKDGSLPKITAGERVEKVEWVPLYKLNKMSMFEDHLGIIDYFTGAL